METVARSAEPSWRPDQKISGSTQYLGGKPYGLEQFSQLFTARQLVALTTFSDLVVEAQSRILSDANNAGFLNGENGLDSGGVDAKAYAEAVAVYLAFAVDRVVDRHTSIAT